MEHAKNENEFYFTGKFAITKLTKASVIDISETKFDSSNLRKEVAIEEYVLINVDRSRKGGGFACFIKHSVGYSL